MSRRHAPFIPMALISSAQMVRALQPGGDNRPQPKGYSVRGAASGEAEVLILSEVGYSYTNPAEFVRELRAISAPQIRVRINSPGGDVFGGVLMYNALLGHAARVVVQIEGVAASIASLIAMAGDEIIMAPGTMMMIHNPHVLTHGNAEELRAVAAVLDKVGESMAGIYRDRTGASMATVRGWMGEDTWFTAGEAVKAKLADREGGTGSPGAAADVALLIEARKAAILEAVGRDEETAAALEKLVKTVREQRRAFRRG